MERGFSVNKSLLVENLATKRLVAQRIVYNHMKVNNVSVEDIGICPILRLSFKHVTQRYSTYLEEQKRTKFRMIDFSNGNKFKRKSQQLARRKPCQKTKFKNADKYAMDAENVSKIDDMKISLSKSNGFQ